MTDEKKKPSYDIDAEAEAYTKQIYDERDPEQNIKDAYKAGAMATLEYAKNAMLQNVDSFNRQCLVDFIKEVKQDMTSRGVSEEAASKALVSFVPLLRKWGLSDAQIKDIGIEIEASE